MSLKTFHLIFITVAILFCLGFGVWCLGQTGYHLLGWGTFVAAAGLVVYEILFVRKFRTR